MKKRLLSVALALALALSLVPVGFAAKTQDTSIVNPAYTYLGAGVYDDVYILEVTVPDDGTIWPYPFLNVTNVGEGGRNNLYDVDAIKVFETGENKGKFSGVKPGEADYMVDFRVGGTPGGEDGTYCIANIRIYVIPAAEYYASHTLPTDAIPKTGSTPGTNTGSNSNTSTNNIINPKFGRYLGTNEYGVHLFDITIPDDETRQPLPFSNISDFSAAAVDSSKIIGYVGLDNTGGDRGKLYGKTPGTSVYRVTVYIGGTPGAHDGVRYSAIVNVTVIPAAEYYGTGTKPGSENTESPHTHRYTDKITKQPTASQPGVCTYTCTICGNTYTESIPATGIITTGTPISKTTNSEAVKSHNINAQNYSGNASAPVKSYLYQNGNGGLTRVEYVGGKVVVEDYDSSFKLQSSWSTQPELPKWGGFYAGKNYNYMVFGQENSTENANAEVIRVVQYTKDWKRINSASLYGANTKDPFAGGSLRFAEQGGYLYVHTCHAMFKSSDGLNHQANVTFAVQQSDMTITDSYYEVSNIRTGYVSHSFNQFLLVDQSGKLVALDHGDAYPRALVMVKYHADASTGAFTSNQRVWCDSTNVLEFPGETGNNATGCSVGGMEETSSGYVVAYSYDGVGGGGSSRDIYLAFTNKNLSSTNKTKLSTGVKATAPQMVSTGLNGGYVLWNEQGGKDYSNAAVGGKLYYTSYDASGKAGTVKTATAPLSDCKPINYNGKIVWYVTSGHEPVFYMLDSSGITSVNTAPAKEETPGTSTQQPGTSTQNPGTGKQTFSDVPAGVFFTEPVAWAVEKEVTNGTTATTFSPYEKCTQVQILTFLWRAAGKPSSDAALPISITGKNIDYAEEALRWAAENEMIDRSFVPNTPCTRASAVTYIWKAFGSPTTVSWSASGGWGGSNFTDVPDNSTLADAISWAVAEEVTNGTSTTTFSPNDICNRGQIVTFLYRAYH